MAISPVDICNMALGAFGANKISSIDQDDLTSDEAEQCSIFYPTCVVTALERCKPLFATGLIDLGSETASPYTSLGSGGGFFTSNSVPPGRPLVSQFAMPTTLLVPLTCDDGSGSFTVLWEQSGRNIVCEKTQQLFCKAISLIDDPSFWSPSFRLVVAYLLASMISGTLTQKASIPRQMEELYEMWIKQTLSVDGMKGSTNRQVRIGSSSLKGRRG